jgi:hypothetical protein
VRPIRWNLSPWVDRDHFFKTDLIQVYKMNFEPECEAMNEVPWMNILWWMNGTHMMKLESLRIDRDDFFKRELTQMNKMKCDLWMWSSKMKFHGWNVLWWMNVAHKMIFHGWMWPVRWSSMDEIHPDGWMWLVRWSSTDGIHSDGWMWRIRWKLKAWELMVSSCDVSCPFKFGICWSCLVRQGYCVENHYRV